MKWTYPDNQKGRDLRLDFMRGLIMVYVILVHMEYGSLFSMFAWERLGIVSSAEGFVLLSGLVVGLVYKRKLLQEGIQSAAKKLWQRSFQLYRVNIFIILSIALLGLIPFVNVYDVTHWVMPGNPQEAYLLYPQPGAPWWEVLYKALLLQIGPHQFQIIGLYVILLALAPIALYAMYKNKTLLLLLVSWIAYGLNSHYQMRLTGARFEWGFPLLTWQLILHFFHGRSRKIPAFSINFRQLRKYQEN